VARILISVRGREWTGADLGFVDNIYGNVFGCGFSYFSRGEIARWHELFLALALRIDNSAQRIGYYMFLSGMALDNARSAATRAGVLI
jgi:hypothetical protein